jgi:putative nucleotidyltransferase with HDIG domain
MKQDIIKIPSEILNIVTILQDNGYQAQIVGGSVRDLLLNLVPKDWDINTDASPDGILKLFPDSFYENDFGTVGVKVREVTRETADTLDLPSNLSVSHETEDVEVVEVTPYRKEGEYKDGRHPETVSFNATLEDDLKRRDFTINSIAFDPIKDIYYALESNKIKKFNGIKDILNSVKDIDNKLISAVGDANKRFKEDFLRMLRAVRLAAQLGFQIEKKTEEAIISNSSNLSSVSRERVRDELSKILMTDLPVVGFLMLQHTKLTENIIPELLLGVGMKQTANHKYDVYGHLIRTMQHAADKGYNLEMRLAALLHDIAKPHTCRVNKSTGWNSFHGHEVVGEKVSREILTRLKFPLELVSRVTILVRWHMFNSDPDQVTMSAVRRMIVNVGRENIWDLMNLRFCDRIGSGRPMEEPHRLRRYFAMIEEALTQATDLKMLKIDGKRIMEVTHETPGRKIGLILNALMGEVLENPEMNTESILENRSLELSKLDNETLKEMSEKGKEEQEDKVEEEKKKIRKKFKV